MIQLYHNSKVHSNRLSIKVSYTRICGNITVFDTKDYALEGIADKFRGILSPMIIASVYARLNVQLESARKHPMEIRRYYRKLDY